MSNLLSPAEESEVRALEGFCYACLTYENPMQASLLDTLDAVRAEKPVAPSGWTVLGAFIVGVFTGAITAGWITRSDR